jgi:FPC/CPF motif-containing protein YcgG
VIPKNTLYFGFVEKFSTQTEMFEQALQIFSEYAEIERQPDPYRVLVLAFDLQTKDWAEDDRVLWDFLDYANSKDPEKWLDEVPKDSNAAGWTFLYKGMPWFFNLNSPNHAHNRDSRNTTGTFTLIIQRTDSFDGLAPVHLHDTVRKELRARIAPYDGQATSPALAGEADNLQHSEWVQYHLPEKNEQKPLSKCPFHAQ